MVKDKLIKMWERKNPNEDNLYMLPKTRAPQPTKYYHIAALGKIYSIWGVLAERWKAECPWNDLVCDCVMMYRGVTVFVEVDLGTEPMETIEEKIRKYIHYSDDPIVFVLQDGVRRRAIKTAENIYRFVSSYVKDPSKARQISWVDIEVLGADPLGRWLGNKVDILTLDELCSIYQGS
jgi:hypothetical protein